MDRNTYQRLYDELPDLQQPPPGGFLGDLCKVKGKAMYFDGKEWRDAEADWNRKISIQLPT